jgi:hypothetical protein
MAACTAGALLVALELARLGAILSAGAVLLVSVGLALYSRHWFVLAWRSRVGARSEDEVQRILDPLRREGWPVRHSMRWQGRGDIDSVALASS